MAAFGSRSFCSIYPCTELDTAHVLPICLSVRKVSKCLSTSVTRLGDLLHFGKTVATIILPNRPNFQAIFVKLSKSFIFGNFYRHLAIFYWSHCFQPKWVAQFSLVLHWTPSVHICLRIWNFYIFHKPKYWQYFELLSNSKLSFI